VYYVTRTIPANEIEAYRRRHPNLEIVDKAEGEQDE